jgi:hypothetical protein
LAASFFAGLTVGSAAVAQADDLPRVTYPTIPATAASVNGFVPKGWKIEKQVSGELSGRGLKDIALVLRDQDPHNVTKIDESKLDTNPRILIVALADPQGGYHLAASNHTLISRPDNPDQDDKLDGVAIARGALQVKLRNFMSAGGWTTTICAYTFRLQNDGLYLIGYDEDDVTRNSGADDILSVNYLTGRYSIAKGTIDSDKHKVRWYQLPEIRSPIPLDKIGDGLEFSPPGVKGWQE